ncbi:MAG: glycosyltransferase family 39 protein [Acidobacteriota bacterium]|nr:glycosyltransferase family 39 protein [Acidobacteriota bacterium]
MSLPLARGGRLLAAVIFLIAFIAFSFNLWSISIGSGWINPVLHTGAQDESAYTHSAIRMAEQGNWMNPMLLGRYVFEKPPLLIWLAAISMRLLGISSLTARLPVVLSGALIASICFAIGRVGRSNLAGVAAALLCLSNPLLFTLSRHNMTDILLTAAAAVALGTLIWDPSLARRGPCLTFMLAITAGVLTKSIAGLPPAIAALLFAGFVTRRPLPQLRRTALLTVAAVLLASPWFVYQLLTHRQWFLADSYFQLITVGIEQPTSFQSHIQFYFLRFLYAAPLTLVLGLTALPALISGVRRRDPVKLVLACFLMVFSAALLSFRFDSETYLAPLLPVAILIAAVGSPLLTKPAAVPVCLVILIAFVIKVAYFEEPWGLFYKPGSTVPAAQILSSYCEERRGNGLYILGVEDQFYALALPLAQVRYGWIDPSGKIPTTRSHLSYLGIVQDAASHPDTALYAARLREWGLNSLEPLGTAISARTIDDLIALVLTHPESDFLVSPVIAMRLGGRQAQETRLSNGECVLLQSRVSHPMAPARWTCRM